MLEDVHKLNEPYIVMSVRENAAKICLYDMHLASVSIEGIDVFYLPFLGYERCFSGCYIT